MRDQLVAQILLVAERSHPAEVRRITIAAARHSATPRTASVTGTTLLLAG